MDPDAIANACMSRGHIINTREGMDGWMVAGVSVLSLFPARERDPVIGLTWLRGFGERGGEGRDER